MATGAFKGGVVEIKWNGYMRRFGELKLTGTVETVQQACQDGNLFPNEMVRNIQMAMSSKSGEYHDKAKGLKVKVNECGDLEIVHKKAEDAVRRKMVEQLFLAGWINLGYSYYEGLREERWGYKHR